MGPSFSEIASFSGRSENVLLQCVCTRATLLHFMPGPNQKRTNSALWIGLLITVLGPLSNFLYYSKIPAAVLPWLNLAMPAIGLLLVLIGVVRRVAPAATLPRQDLGLHLHCAGGLIVCRLRLALHSRPGRASFRQRSTNRRAIENT